MAGPITKAIRRTYTAAELAERDRKYRELFDAVASAFQALGRSIEATSAELVQAIERDMSRAVGRAICGVGPRVDAAAVQAAMRHLRDVTVVHAEQRRMTAIPKPEAE